MAQDVDIKDQFKFPMTSEGYGEFESKMPLETWMAVVASWYAYVVSSALRNMIYSDIIVAHPKTLMNNKVK